jgi:hypothetical protein
VQLGFQGFAQTSFCNEHNYASPTNFFCLIKKSQQKKSRLHFSFLSAMAMQANATMGATSYIYWVFQGSVSKPILRNGNAALTAFAHRFLICSMG